MKKPMIRILKADQSVVKSIINDTFAVIALSFMVYLSKDSTWWTLVTGSMFIVFMYGKIMVAFRGMNNEFGSTDEVREWLDEIDAGNEK